MTHNLPVDYVLIAAISYLFGSIPFGYILLRVVRGEDVRKLGSGNIGATNVARSSPSLGILTLLLDALKGFLAVFLTHVLFRGPILCMFVAGLFAIVGHLFPMWLAFKGGKGVATGLGAFVILTPKAMLVMLGIFVVVVAISRYVSLGSILAVGFFPLLGFWLDGYRDTPEIAIMCIASILILSKHHANFARLFAGTEHRFGRSAA
ncbi:MAG: glycerol-3-phosphate 1-O-acyltransferase PlsY [Terriglobales bacterium]|jgi:glycerol-3-phosphate acyltransferase PlsY